MTFQNNIIDNTVNKLIKGEDYREEILRSINATFLDFSLFFFQTIVNAKMSDEGITLEWYKKYFLNEDNFSPEEAAIFAGINKKSITNIYGSATKEIVFDVANANFEYISSLLTNLENDVNSDFFITIKICYKDISVDLSLSESLMVINALATKKIQIRGGAWSAIGKKVEKPLIDRLCKEAGVYPDYIDNSHFVKDKSKSFDREVDYKLKSRTGVVYRIEVKLMGKGNPESADATIARDSDIFVADTLSEQNCNQLKARGVKFLVLKDNKNIINDFKKILIDLDIPFEDDLLNKI